MISDVASNANEKPLSSGVLSGDETGTVSAGEFSDGGEGGHQGSMDLPRVQRKITNLKNDEGGSKPPLSKKDRRGAEQEVFRLIKVISSLFAKDWPIIPYDDIESYAYWWASGNGLKRWEKLVLMCFESERKAYAYMKKSLNVRTIEAVCWPYLLDIISQSGCSRSPELVMDRLKGGDFRQLEEMKEFISERQYSILKKWMTVPHGSDEKRSIVKLAEEVDLSPAMVYKEINNGVKIFSMRWPRTETVYSYDSNKI